MPRQVVAAVRAHNKGVPDQRLRDHFYRVQKDVLFLFHLHSQINEHAFETEETRQLRLQLLRERLRALILRTWGGEQDRFDDAPPARASGRTARRRRKTPEETALERDIVDWPVEEALLWAEVISLKEAERILSVRYVAGESLFFPQTLRALDETLESLVSLYGSYESVLDGRPPEGDADFARWMSAKERRDKPTSRTSGDTEPPLRPRTTRIARGLAERFVMRARAETLQQLGEGDAGIALMQDWMRSEAADPVG